MVDQFLSLTQDLSVIKPHGMEAEILHPNSPSHVQHDMDGIYTLRTDFNDDEIVRRESLRSLMTGNSRSNKHLADADHLFEAWKYGGRYFVTHDKRNLNATPRLRQIIPGVEPVTLEDMVSILKAYAPEQE